MKIRRTIQAIPGLGKLVIPALDAAKNRLFPGSREYWENRYRQGGDSGSGSYHRLAEFKARILNDFVRDHAVTSVIEFGCGDGNQLTYARYPRYIGLDVSRTALARAIARFPADASKSFFPYDSATFVDRTGVFRADLALSLDVLYHLVEDDVFEKYLADVFGSATRHVIVYSSNEDSEQVFQVRHRNFTRHVAARLPEWRLVQTIPNDYPFDPADPDRTSKADFFVFDKADH